MSASIEIDDIAEHGDSMTLLIIAEGSLSDWQYNLEWGIPDKWTNCTVTHTVNEDVIEITENVAMCTEYGVSIRAKNSNGQYVTSTGYKYIKTSGHAVLHKLDDFVIGSENEQYTISWKWDIKNTDYYYDVSILNKNDDLIIKLYEDVQYSQTGDNISKTAPLSVDEVKVLYGAGEGEFQLCATTKSAPTSYGAYVLAADIQPINVVIGAGAKPTFTTFDMAYKKLDGSPSSSVIKGYSQVVINWQDKVTTHWDAEISKYLVEIIGTGGSVAKAEFAGNAHETVCFPDEAGLFYVKVTAIDSSGGATSVEKGVNVQDYKPVRITSVSASRGENNQVNLEMTGKCYLSPTITYKYNTSQGDVSGTCTYNPTTNEFSYHGVALTLDTSGNVDVTFTVKDDYTNESATCYIPSNNVLILEQELDNGIKKVRLGVSGRIQQNSLNIMGYVGVLDDLERTSIGGIYEVDENTLNFPASANGTTGFLEVLPSPHMLMQRLTLYHTTDPNRYDIFIRFYVNSNFTAWKQIY